MRKPVTEAQIRQIYSETIDTLYSFASRKCAGDRQLAEDVTQETWLRAVREWARAGLPDNPMAWLTVVARNLLLNVLRQREPLPLDAVPEGDLLSRVDDEMAADSAEADAAVRGALARLPQEQSSLLQAFHYQRIKVAQIAERLGTSERAVEGRLRRARESLRKELEATHKREGELT